MTDPAATDPAAMDPAGPDSWWDLAGTAAAVLAVAPALVGGIRLRAHAGPVRDAWLNGFRTLLGAGLPLRRMPATIADGRLLGGLDLAATLSSGQPVAERGLLAEADGGVLLLAMAERLTSGMAARLAAVTDTGEVLTERDGIALRSTARFGMVALDEGLDDEERPPAALLDRLAMAVDLRAIAHRELTPFACDHAAVVAARDRLGRTVADARVIAALCSASAALGLMSLRAPLQALAVARVLAALAGRDGVADVDAALAATLVLAPRATQIPVPQSDEQTVEEETSEQKPQDEHDLEAPEESVPRESDTSGTGEAPLDDIVTEAAVAAIPAGLLAALRASGGKLRARAAGRSGLYQTAANRGRVIGFKAGDLRGGARLDVVETLRAAAPWQGLRRIAGQAAIAVRRDDFRVARYKHRTETSTIFVVDASGSSALQRLAEAKGAVRLLLAECYIRRDEVALIAFRGTTAETILPPTRALVRAQRALAQLPGGGGTPIATAIDAAATLAGTVRRSGRTPAIVFMTDGRANIGRDGSPGRPRAQADALAAARALSSSNLSVILIDTSPKPQALAAELAAAMGARYVPLPQADAQRVAAAVTMMLPARGAA